MTAMLTRTGYHLNETSGVWSRDNYHGIAYSDGDEIEERLSSIIGSTSDLTVLSEELREHCKDWPSLYHLSSLRANLLRPFGARLKGDVLEIGAGCGAITRYLGECGGNVLALEGSLRRASIARSRSRDLTNVTVVAERFDDFESDARFDVVTLVGVLEYANLFVRADNPTLSMLERARALLKPGGLLLLAIENQLGLKYFAGAPEDHIGRPMYGIENQYLNDEPRTFGRKALDKLLTQAGYVARSFLAPFPDYKVPNSIITESGFEANDFDGAALACQSVPFDPQLPRLLAFSPELVWPVVAANGLTLDLANSFLVAASNGDAPVLDTSVLGWHYSTNRREIFSKETSFEALPNGKIEVQYRRLSRNPASVASAGPLRMILPERAPHVSGVPLSQRFIDIISRDGWSLNEARLFFSNYIDFLESLLVSSEDKPSSFEKIESSEQELPGFFFDVVPHNIIVDADGCYHLIDKEWDLNQPASAGFIMFRSLLNLISMTRRIGSSQDLFERTPLGLILAIMDAIGWPVTKDTVFRYAEMESIIQVAVQGGSTKLDKMLEWLESDSLVSQNIFEKTQDDNRKAIEDRGELARLIKVIEDRDSSIIRLRQLVSEREFQVDTILRSITELYSSTSWKITTPVRILGVQVKRVRRLIKLLPHGAQRGGGLFSTGLKAVRILRKEGLVGIRGRLRFIEATKPASSTGPLKVEGESSAYWGIVPYYVDPRIDDHVPSCSEGPTVGVHLHLFDLDALDKFADRLSNIPITYDLFVSIPEDADVEFIKARLVDRAPRLGNLAVEHVPHRGHAVASLIVQFGARLSSYDIIGHFETKSSPRGKELNYSSEDALDQLLGPLNSNGGRVAHLFSLLSSNAKVIYAEGVIDFLETQKNKSLNFEIARKILGQYAGISVEGIPRIEFPEDGMFWARGNCVGSFLNLPMSFTDFPEEPGPSGDELSHTLERLILVFAHQFEGEFLRLHRRDSIQDFLEYEERQDFSTSIIHNDVQVLAYYLPQFHPIPENDEWHGKGFTEWTKVRAANPLFEGHYQQHIPHPDIGYYLLDTPETLRVQASMMQSSGVHGMIFYHYWFGGRMILEHPARMLLDNPDIQMPFCFCWANENWTKRWDGNENEILLAQNYSAEDARAFIRYLIPFFRDPRHVRVGGRPVLYIYRPASIPDISAYVDTWSSECRSAGLEAPFLVAVLTRGALDPRQFRMDAGVERVLHDWTGGGVPELKGALNKYQPIKGSVLSYDDVADFYSFQTATDEFTYFRSLVPMWDNTARYGNGAYVVHGSTPERFQRWLENLMAYSKQNLPADRRIIVVNAWNEWAEGAHLEPDSRYGYAYLNAIGRALSDKPYSARSYPSQINFDCTRIHLSFRPEVLRGLEEDALLAQRFMHVLARSSIFQRCTVTVDPEFVNDYQLPVSEGNRHDAQFVLEVRGPAFFGPHAIEKMIQDALENPRAVIVPNFLKTGPLPHVSPNGSISPADAFQSPLILYPADIVGTDIKNIRMRADASMYPATPNTQDPNNLPVVTTILRVHKSADLESLRNALCCLAAMHNCICVPLIAAQDLSLQQTQVLSGILRDLAWYPEHLPRVDHFTSNEGQRDLRSRMLNESLRKVETRYVGFLDYDDLLMPHAYEWLIARLLTTGKAVSFGRVYDTTFSSLTGLRLKRSRTYEYGYSYEEFIGHNHAPLHSFLIDKTKISVDDIVYHEDQRFMEDYYLTLQIFRKENCDWESLRHNVYVGEYLHSVDRAHTLAFVDDGERQEILKNPSYQLCEKRIVELRRKLLSSNGLNSEMVNERVC